MTKYISIGWVAQAGVTAALLAGLGYTGDVGILDGPEGFWRLFGGTQAHWNADRLVSGLGEEWLAPKPWYKTYPCEVLIGVAINRLREIIRANGLAPGEIDGIEFRSLPVLATPCHTTTELVTHVDAQFSVPYALAVAAHGIEPGPAWQDEKTMRDPKIRSFMDKVSVGVQAEDAGGASSVGHIPLHLDVLAHGKRLSVERVEPFMSRDELVAKFEKNAASRLAAAQVDRARDLILGLESLDDVSRLTEYLVPDGNG